MSERGSVTRESVGEPPLTGGERRSIANQQAMRLASQAFFPFER
jgi:hypothetical protein